ncbi:dipeptidase [Thalassomonas haliotis]|uniref:Membrane dipeptidase n=1 Tax=Thalassomonas haliotis TaxID=485448 RepID=A0ABY7VNE7_9GAMM|nr:membrane dipeptidase [Thalassomonas haliotis]WDE14022.1 membrane dipeptidase [Thalassomonas haliotis]
MKTTDNTGNSRRKFLKNLAVASVGASGLLSATSGFAHAANVAAAIKSSNRKIRDWLIIDGLGAIYDPNFDYAANPDVDPYLITERAKRDIRASGLTVLRQTTGAVKASYPGDNTLETAISNISWVHEWIYRNSDFLTLIKSADDILAAKKNNQVGVTLGFQNSHVLGKNVEMVDVFRALGVLTMQLTYNGQNQLGGGANVNEKIKLTDFGHKAVEKMNDSKVIIDLSHAGRQTCLDAIKASKSPLTISHSGCRALADFPRNKTDQEMKLLADNGGLFGLYFMPFLAADSNATGSHLVAHIEHALNICGEDHVSFGTDGTYVGIDDMEKHRENTAKFTQRRLDSGTAAAGEKIGNVNLLPDLAGPEQFLRIADMLSSRGHKEATIEKIFGRNSMRLMQEVWG